MQRRVAFGPLPGLSRAKLTFMSLSLTNSLLVPPQGMGGLSLCGHCNPPRCERPLPCEGENLGGFTFDFHFLPDDWTTVDPVCALLLCKKKNQNVTLNNIMTARICTVNKQCHTMFSETCSKMGATNSEWGTHPPSRNTTTKTTAEPEQDAGSYGGRLPRVFYCTCAVSRAHAHTD